MYPEWAPKELIDQLARSIEFYAKFPQAGPEQIISETLSDDRFRNMSAEAIENLRAQLYRNPLMYPADESLKILKALLTDLRMKSVWSTLKRREKTERDLLDFWSAIQTAFFGWRGEPKLTSKGRKEIFQQIFDHLASLQSLMLQVREFQYYSVNALIDDEQAKWLLDQLDARPFSDEQESVNYARFCLHDIVPSIDRIFTDIAKKAQAFGQEPPIVLKPASDNAQMHYFVRRLSSFLNKSYGQPLHEVVAITTSVVLDPLSIDADLVRKLVQQ